jgi:sugar phosphate isomerase/epimerase
MAISLSCCDHSFPLLPHDQVCRLVQLLGFDAIDLALWGGSSHIRPEEIRADVAGWAARVRERVDEHGLAVSDVFVIPDPDYASMAVNHPVAAERARGRMLFEELVDFAAALGAPGITLLPGLPFDPEALERAADELAARVARGKRAGLRVSVEPHVGSVVDTPAATERLLELTPGLGLTLDYSHFVVQGHPIDTVDDLLPRVRHVHARAARADRLQVAMKENAIDFERVVAALRAAGYSGRIATEYLWIDASRCDECDTLSETILMRDRLRTAMNEHPDANGGLAMT